MDKYAGWATLPWARGCTIMDFRGSHCSGLLVAGFGKQIRALVGA